MEARPFPRSSVAALVLLLLLGSPSDSFSFGSHSTKRLSTLSRLPVATTRVLHSHAKPITSSSTHLFSQAAGSDESSSILPAVVVGSVTATLGFAYGKVLSAAVHALWTSLPSILIRNGVQINPRYYIPSVLGFGGLLMGVLSAKLPGTFTVADFVSAFSAVPSDSLPSSRTSLLPLLLLSLVTSTFGFSVGPEAPMVCAGGLVGASLARRWFDKSKATTLAYAGAAGALTAFMGIPIAGSIFALELTRASASLASGNAVSPAVAASVAGILVLRAILMPSAGVGGHFDYGVVGMLSGRSMIVAALASSVGGALIGTVFHKTVALIKNKL